jgi:hypothetical protein
VGGTIVGSVGATGGTGGSLCGDVSGWISDGIFVPVVQPASIFQVQIHPCIVVSTGVAVSEAAVLPQLQFQFQTHVLGSAPAVGA